MNRNVQTSLALLIVLLLQWAFPFFSIAQQPVLPWLESIGAQGGFSDIHTVSTEAAVTVSDGLTYTVHTVFHDGQRAIFRREYADRITLHKVWKACTSGHMTVA